MSPREQLTEPLLAAEERSTNNNEEGEALVDVVAADLEACPPIAGATGSSPPEGDDDEGFSVKTEIWEMFNLGLPLAVSFCK